MSDSEEENNTLNVEEEREAAKKAADEAAEAKRIADEEAAKKAADEAAEAKRIADEEAAKKAADEEAAKKAADEEAAKKATDEAAELAEQLLELTKLNAITNNLWKEGQKTNFESMSHTVTGVLKHELKKRSDIHQGFMTSLTKNTNKILRQNVSSVKQKPVANLNTRQTMFNSGMMFGNRR